MGVIIAGWSVFHFLKVKGTPVPLNPPPKLVDTGPYPNFGDTLLNLVVGEIGSHLALSYPMVLWGIHEE